MIPLRPSMNAAPLRSNQHRGHIRPQTAIKAQVSEQERRKEPGTRSIKLDVEMVVCRRVGWKIGVKKIGWVAVGERWVHSNIRY